jgi:hypothetical protein
VNVLLKALDDVELGELLEVESALLALLDSVEKRLALEFGRLAVEDEYGAHSKLEKANHALEDAQ